MQELDHIRIDGGYLTRVQTPEGILYIFSNVTISEVGAGTAAAMIMVPARNEAMR